MQHHDKQHHSNRSITTSSTITSSTKTSSMTTSSTATWSILYRSRQHYCNVSSTMTSSTIATIIATTNRTAPQTKVCPRGRCSWINYFLCYTTLLTCMYCTVQYVCRQDIKQENNTIVQNKNLINFMRTKLTKLAGLSSFAEISFCIVIINDVNNKFLLQSHSWQLINRKRWYRLR